MAKKTKKHTVAFPTMHQVKITLKNAYEQCEKLMQPQVTYSTDMQEMQEQVIDNGIDISKKIKERISEVQTLLRLHEI